MCGRPQRGASQRGQGWAGKRPEESKGPSGKRANGYLRSPQEVSIYLTQNRGCSSKR